MIFRSCRCSISTLCSRGNNELQGRSTISDEVPSQMGDRRFDGDTASSVDAWEPVRLILSYSAMFFTWSVHFELNRCKSNHCIFILFCYDSVKRYFLLQAPMSDDLGEVIRSLTFERLRAPTEGLYKAVQSAHPDAVGRPPRLGSQARTMIGNVRTFFDELKRQIGDEGRGTIFSSPAKLTALACGISLATVYNVSSSGDFIHRPLPRGRKAVNRTRKHRRTVMMRRYGEHEGDIVRHFIHSKLKQRQDVTSTQLCSELTEAYPTFRMSTTSE